ncbi:MAG: ferritin-like domain-containing protein [Alphaproteobacteria bacterium]
MSRYWSLDDIEWGGFRPDLVDGEMLAVVKAAALVEANAPDYVQYLCNVFKTDAALCEALEQWGREEEQHGDALARWAAMADPTFDFERALSVFRSDFEQVPLDTEESIRGSRLGELFARCVVESGTTSFYAAMEDKTDEPVLKQIARNISADEVRHYKLFRRQLDDYEGQEPPLSKLARCRILADRVAERNDDEFGFAYYAANIALKSDEPYDRDYCMLAYELGSFGIYKQPHLEKAAKMMLRAIGFRSDSLISRGATRLAWWMVQRRQREIFQLAEGLKSA